MLFFEKKIEKYLILHTFKEINKISRINITFLFVLTNDLIQSNKNWNKKLDRRNKTLICT